MGNVCPGGGGNSEEAAQNARIEEQLKRARKDLENEVKILLLGAGESGKSTVAKQMKIIHLQGFTPEEKANFKNLVFQNVLRAAKTLVEESRKRSLVIEDAAAADLVDGVQINTAHISYTPDLAKAVTAVWGDPASKELLNLTSQFQWMDSAPYFLDNAERFCDPEFTPSDLDILRVRSKTTGISETVFLVSKRKFRMVDVGGQRNERKKWIHCFQDVTAIIFCVALNEYDLMLEEDPTVNRMHESLKLFGDIINNMWFEETSIILFLNKKDLFEEKIKRVDLSLCFRQYDGGFTYKAGTQYIRKKFLEKNRGRNRQIYAHETCATDTNNIRFVFNAVEDIFINQVIDELM
mmetsp:Transcript_16259/g.63389  ORF Transcript_16259/g.63389 Transcript_16259/m.63389 type:complete len:351 (+) Transcript_16259:209-1261(+)